MAKKKQKAKDEQIPVPEERQPEMTPQQPKSPEEDSGLPPDEEEEIIREVEDIAAVEYCLEMALQAYTMVISRSLQPFVGKILSGDPPSREEVMDSMKKVRVGEKNLLERILSLLPGGSGRLTLFKQ